MKRGWLDYVIGMDFGQFFFATLLVLGFWKSLLPLLPVGWRICELFSTAGQDDKDLYNATLF